MYEINIDYLQMMWDLTRMFGRDGMLLQIVI